MGKLLEVIFGKEWGPKLFLTAMFFSLVFFWWLVLYSHGVTPHHWLGLNFMRLLNNPAIALVVAFIIALLLFYFMDHGIMSMQGLPLNADLTPAQ